MRAALISAPGCIELIEAPQPPVESGNVLVAVEYVGICGSDVELYSRDYSSLYPLIPGHEMIGRIVETNLDSSKRLLPGTRVTIEPNYLCGQCYLCLTGRGNLCPKRVVAGVTAPGFLSEYVSAPAEFVWRIPEQMSSFDAVGIEPGAVAYHALKVTGAPDGSTIAVIGAGMIGLLIIKLASHAGLKVLAIEKEASKLVLAHRAGAIESLLMDGSASVIETCRERCSKLQVEAVFECSGSVGGTELALNIAPAGSRVALVGMAGMSVQFLPSEFVLKGLRLIGALTYDHPQDFAETIALISHNAIKPHEFVTMRCSFDHAAEAFAIAATRKQGKIVIDVRG